MNISIFLEDEDIILKSFDNKSFEMAEENLWKLQRGYLAELQKLDDEIDDEDDYSPEHPLGGTLDRVDMDNDDKLTN